MKRIISVLAAGLLLASACVEPVEEPKKTLDTFTVTPTTAAVEEGESFKLKYEAKPAYKDLEVTFETSNKDVATVNEKGVVTAVAEGEATITLKNNIDDKIAECKVTVMKKVELMGITIEPAELNVAIGATVKVNMTPNPVIPDLEYTWTSSNNDVATVDAEGNVTGIAEGEATITVTNALFDKSASCKVIVTIKLFDGGKGTASDPYQIGTLESLQLLADYSLGGETVSKYSFENANYILTNDIVVNPMTAELDSIIISDVTLLATAWATSDKPFKGTFDGNGKTIEGICMGNDFLASRDTTYKAPYDDDNEQMVNYATGLFGFVEGATIKNLTIKRAHIQSKGVNVGGIAGVIRGGSQVINCKVLGGVPSPCYEDGALKSNGNVSIRTQGGTYIYGKGKYRAAKVGSEKPFGDDSYYFSYGLVGGIAGQVVNSTVENCEVDAYVRCGQRNAAFITGYMGGTSTIKNCKGAGLVYCGMTHFAGIAGSLMGEGVIDGCTVTGFVSGKYSYGGGVVAFTAAGGTIKNCVMSGGVTLFNPAAAANFVGGILGYNKLNPVTVENCKAINADISATGNGIAGIVGRSDATITIKNCYVSDSKIYGLKDHQGWTTDFEVDNTKGSVGAYNVCGILAVFNSNVAGATLTLDNCYVANDLQGSYGCSGILSNSSGNQAANKGLYSTVSNCFYKGKLTAWGKNSYHHAMLAGISANPNSNANSTIIQFANVAALPEIELRSIATAGSLGGLLGYSQNNVQCVVGYTDITRAKMLEDGVAVAENRLRHGGLFGITNSNDKASNGTNFLYKGLFYSENIQYGTTNGGVADMEECYPLTDAQFTNGTLLNYLNAAVDVYNADARAKATAKKWVAGEGGFPIIEGLPTK